MIKTRCSSRDIPDTLISFCLERIFENPQCLSKSKLPPELGDLLASGFRNNALIKRLSEADCENFFMKFNCRSIPIRRVDFSNLPISPEFFMKFLEEYHDSLEEVQINECPKLKNMSPKMLSRIVSLTKTGLKSLNLNAPLYDDDDEEIERAPSLHGLQLKELTINNVQFDEDEFSNVINQYFSYFVTPSMYASLRHLDLSKCSIGTGSFMLDLVNLEALILFNSCIIYPPCINTICQLKNLQTLDLSQQFPDAEDALAVPSEDTNLLLDLVNSLPLLSRLDISGTNLVCGKDRHIAAFEARVDRPFEFLGLFHTTNDAAYKTFIPALTVAGDANEAQLLQACTVYMDRPEMLMRALSDIFNLYKSLTPSETIEDVNAVLSVIMPIITRHLTNEQVMISATAALWCILRIITSSRNFSDSSVRRIITSQLLDVMHYHRANQAILSNGALVLAMLPDIACENSRVATIALHMCRESCSRVKGIGTNLMNTLACQVGNEQKVNIGNLGTVEIMIDIALAKIEEDCCDEVLEIAWSTLWNITDETPSNCQKYLEYKGLEAFKKCMDKFGQNKEVLRNIMGLLGNVAECQHLRKEFMHEEYIRRFNLLLSSNIDGIECSYNACGIIAHIISEGETFWLEHIPDLLLRQEVLDRMRDSISKWPINSRRNINYRSLEPIIRLLDVNIEPEAQYWAVFALANLIRVNPAKYCEMLHPYDGLKKLQLLAQVGITKTYVQQLANLAWYQYDKFTTEGTLNGLEQCSSIDLEAVKNFRPDPNNGDGTSDFGEPMNL